MNNFKDSNLRPEIIDAISELGFVEPTPIQAKTIPAIMENNSDIIALAETGTGKTAGFGLPIINNIDSENRSVQALILCPTRELCLQITKDLKAYSKYMPQIGVTAVYGGANTESQIKELKKNIQIVVGTPGRTLDLIKRRSLKVENITQLVLDEADEMLNMGFKEELDGILSSTPKDKQTLLFSATMLPEVRRIATNYMSSPIEISVGSKNIGAKNVSHHYYVVKAGDRYLALKRLADYYPDIYGIVFCRTREETKQVASNLMGDGYNADALHGDLSQAQRDLVMQRFRAKQIQLLVATDVAARGIDVNDLTHVLNYNLPDDPEIYIHRSGRTGRAGKLGISVVISHTREGRRISELERIVGKKFDRKYVPGGKEICEIRLLKVIEQVKEIQVNEEQISPYLANAYKNLSEFDKDEIIKRFLSVEFNHFLEYYKNAPDLNGASQKDSGRDSKDKSSDRKQRKVGKYTDRFSRFYINIGEKHHVTPPSLIGVINENTRNRDIEIGKIDIMRNFSFFDVDNDYVQDILDAFADANYGGTKILVELSKPDVHGDKSSKSNMSMGPKPYSSGKKHFNTKDRGKKRHRK